MPYTTPEKTWAAAAVLTAAELNTYVRDNVQWLANDKPRCWVRNTAAQSIPNTTVTALTFDTELVDVGGCHSTVSNTSRITVPTGGAGFWLFGGTAALAVSATGMRRLLLQVNGTTTIAYSGHSVGSASEDARLNICQAYQVFDADYVELCVQQTSGGNLNSDVANPSSPTFWGVWQAF